MSNNNFHFKQFSVSQEKSAMKVGTDGVLLGAWCQILPTDKAMLDIGSGTGLIALQLAQRTPSEERGCNKSDTKSFADKVVIEAVEIDPEACEEAQQNFDASKWSDRLKLHRMSVQEFSDKAKAAGTKFDHIVSNPPYFTDSLLTPDRARSVARHTDTLSYKELVEVCDKLLKPEGRFSVILPAATETERMTTVAGECGFTVSRRTEVHSTPKSGAKRCLSEFSRVQKHRAIELS